MNIEELQSLCESFPHTTTEIKWENDLCFCIGGKMFLVIGLNNHPTKASFKVTNEDFEIMCNTFNISPAPYLARYKWIMVENISLISPPEWEKFAKNSYSLVKEKLPAKVKKQLNNL